MPRNIQGNEPVAVTQNMSNWPSTMWAIITDRASDPPSAGGALHKNRKDPPRSTISPSNPMMPPVARRAISALGGWNAVGYCPVYQ